MATVGHRPPDPPETVGHLVAAMRSLAHTLPATDGVAVFNRLYLSVTEEVQRRLRQGYFADPTAAARLTVRFGARYLYAVRQAAAGRRVPDCWWPLFRSRADPGIHPVQFALCGINAHIGHDLALAVVDTCRELDCAPDVLATDFARVGVVLAALERRVREELMPGPDPLESAEPLTHLVSAWSVAAAREAAWCASRALWAVRRLPRLAAELAERLDEGVGLVGRLLLVTP